jgi:hypothetical protein
MEQTELNGLFVSMRLAVIIQKKLGMKNMCTVVDSTMMDTRIGFLLRIHTSGEI